MNLIPDWFVPLIHHAATQGHVGSGRAPLDNRYLIICSLDLGL